MVNTDICPTSLAVVLVLAGLSAAAAMTCRPLNEDWEWKWDGDSASIVPGFFGGLVPSAARSPQA